MMIEPTTGRVKGPKARGVQAQKAATLALALAALAAAGPANAAQAGPDPLAPLPEQPAEPTPRPAAPLASPPLAIPLVRLAPPAATPLRPAPAAAASAPRESFAAYKRVLAARARAAGVREATIAAVIDTLTLNPRVIRLDRAQPGGVNNPNAIPPFAPYRQRHVTRDLVTRGAARFAANRAWLEGVERRTGVEASVLMAIYGHETSYGAVTGGFDLFEALATLAYEGRRRDFFADEFVAALKLLDRGTPRSRLKGSWAGATGKGQFMPSAVLRLAADGDGDGRADIWGSEPDGFASIANYLRDAGWKPHVHWGVAVRTPAALDRAALVSRVKAPRCPRVYDRHSRWLTMAEWRARGVVPVSRSLPDGELATLIEPDGPNATAYLLSTNYRAILDYNCSNFYALSVGLLADAIVGG